ncbi:Uncharacterised protein [uncultured archaeon]|nr:Uncharacterised protein [uncultured archaeon]
MSLNLRNALAQRVLDSKGNEPATKVIRLIQNDGFEPTTSQKRAREIMGKNIFGVEEGIKHLGVNPTRQQLAVLSEIPFSDAMLDQSKDTHVLVAVFPLSILEIRGKVARKLFYNHETAWYNEQFFAKEHGEVNWQLVRKTPVDNSTSVNWQEQQALFCKDDIVPTAQVLVYTIIGHLLATGERLVERKYARTSSVDSDGNCVYVSDVGSNGLGISDYWDAVGYDNEDRSSARKL